MRFSFLLAQGLLGLGLLGLSCSSPPKPAATDDTVVRFAERANLAFGRGRMDDAVRAFEQGLQRARETDDPQAIGDAAYNLGVCRFQLGEVVEATELFREALYELDRAGDALADVFVMLAKASARLGDPVGAEALAAAVEADPRSRPTYQHRAEIAVLRGEVRLAASDLAGAADHLKSARELAGRARDPWVEANVLGLSARLRLKSSDWAGAAADFDERAELLRTIGQYGVMVVALEGAGAAWASAGDACLATDRWLRAARTRDAAGSQSEALLACQQALDAAKACKDPEIVSRALGLARHLERSPESHSE
ncbi:MAG: tetratricopeptide (TPR) repeat protein [Planctomycetota bacterium]|jgi:tetratricopeptide (TPR) repeat protein